MNCPPLINKILLLEEIIKTLEALYQDAFDAAMRAYNTATDDENEAENKYDTLGLEAAYLAQGQSKRVAECEADLKTFKKLKDIKPAANKNIVLGTLIHLVDRDGKMIMLFLGPTAGGLKINFNGESITVITPSAPLGKALLGRFIDDEFEFKPGHSRHYYTITNIF